VRIADFGYIQKDPAVVARYDGEGGLRGIGRKGDREDKEVKYL
jgi:hypothetical protein